MHEDLIQLIEQSNVAFPKFDNGVSQAAVSRAETELGFPLPASYKWWLLKYGGGQIKGDIVYGIDEVDMDRPDVVKLARLNERNLSYGKSKLVFSIGNAENFFFDTTEMKDGEYRVFVHDITQGDPIPYAASFAEFLKKRIRELYRIK